VGAEIKVYEFQFLSEADLSIPTFLHAIQQRIASFSKQKLNYPLSNTPYREIRFCADPV